MRLLNTKSITLKEFIGQEIPSYAILSHTWETEEVLLAHIQNGTAPSRKGYDKINRCCLKAAEQGFQWVWIDTCCIDKTSSAELSEAINSMYRWYAMSSICYAYLQDVAVTLSLSKRIEKGKASIFTIANFHRSRWFTRGWTLQELLAPIAVEFYSLEWKEIGTKASLAQALAAVTGIPNRVICGDSASSCSIAARMSWASTRQTTREEDMAYCLLGLFSINMPLLYGEGQKSFLRLQEQILKQQEDYSIFAWTLQHDYGEILAGLLASTPHEFSNLVPQHLQPPTLLQRLPVYETAADVGTAKKKSLDPRTFSSEFGISGLKYTVLHDKDYNKIRRYDMQDREAEYVPQQPPVLTSRGISLTLPLMPSKDPDTPSLAWIYCTLNAELLCIALLPCSKTSRLHGRHAAPWLISVDKSSFGNFSMQEVWLHPSGLITSRATEADMLDLFTISSSSLPPTWGRLKIVSKDSGGTTSCIVSAYPTKQWMLDEFFFQGAPMLIGLVGIECLVEQGNCYFMVYCGIQSNHPWCMVLEATDSNSSEEHAAELMELFHDLGRNAQSGYTYSDRAACVSRRTAKIVFTSAIRRAPAAQQNSNTYVLQIGAHVVGQCDPWVDYCLVHMNQKKHFLDPYSSRFRS